MKKYFRLNSYCYLVEGEENECIYNLNNGNMILLNKENSEMLKLCEKNMELNNIPELDYEFLNKLRDMDIGLYHDVPVFIDKLAIGTPPQLESVILNYKEVSTVFIELSTKCNFNCVFCKDNDNKLFRKTGCKRWSVGDKIESVEKWKILIQQVLNLSCKHIIFIGGEPFLQYELLKELCIYAFESGISKISIYTNGSLLNENILRFIKKYDIELNIQLLGYTDYTYEKITGMSDMGTVMLNNVKRLAVENIKYKLCYLISKFNEDEIEKFFKEYAQFTKHSQLQTDFIYPVPKNEFYSTKFLNLMYDKKSSLSKAGINVNHFCNRKKQHNCYGYQIGITADGDVIPCIMSRNFVLGNVKEKDISDILSNSKYEYYRKLTKDSIDKCKSCALKYGCFDCRALEYSASGDVHGLEYCNINL